MRDDSFQLEPSLLAPIGPFSAAHPTAPPWRWTVRDGLGGLAATARTRAGARAAMRRLYAASARTPA